jgi:plastocyanin
MNEKLLWSNIIKSKKDLKSMQRQYLIATIVVVLVLVGIGIYYFATSNIQNTPPSDSTQSKQTDVSSSEKTFTIIAENFSFSPAQITVSKGEKVKIILNNVEGYHDFVVDEFNARTDRVQGSTTTQVEFIADKTGTFEYYCSVGNHRQMGMKGNLVVQ